MDQSRQKISVRIGGMSYNLITTESESYTRQIAARADEMIRRVSMASPQLSQQMTIVLALTNAVDELTRQAVHQALAEQQKEAAEQKAGELRIELNRARELNWEMKKELLRLNTLCREQAARLALMERQAVMTSEADRETIAHEPESTDLAEPAETAVHAETAEPAESAEPTDAEREDCLTLGELRQTGLEEYLSSFGWSSAASTERTVADEPAILSDDES